MHNTIEHISLNGCIVYHILEDNILSDLQLVIKFPIPHIVTTKTAIASKTINGKQTAFCCGNPIGNNSCSTNRRCVRHLQTVRHMTGKTDIKNGSLYSLVFYDINDLRD